MGVVLTIVIGVLSSIIASLIFWMFTFYISRTKVEFSDSIEKSPSKGEYPGKYRYRIRIVNSGWRDLIEISVIVKISVRLKGRSVRQFTHLGIGNDNTIAVMRGKKYCIHNSNKINAHTNTLFVTEVTRNEFKKTFYSPSMVEKAKDGTLSLDDILEEYGESVKIQIFIYGNDALTGARKMFVSREYTSDDIKEGSFPVSKSFSNRRRLYRQYGKYVKHALQLSKDPVG